MNASHLTLHCYHSISLQHRCLLLTNEQYKFFSNHNLDEEYFSFSSMPTLKLLGFHLSRPWSFSDSISVCVLSVFCSSSDLRTCIQTLIESLFRMIRSSRTIRHWPGKIGYRVFHTIHFAVTIIVASCRVCWSFLCGKCLDFHLLINFLYWVLLFYRSDQSRG